LYASEFDGKRFDCGSKLGFIEANINFAMSDKEINKNLRKIISKL
jgi:UTP--glucose-1-phosphate uridylyltransferase